jgi:hypothetical protein
MVAADLQEVGEINRSGAATPSSHWKPVNPSPPPKKDWFDALLPWLVTDERTGHTPLGTALWLAAWVGWRSSSARAAARRAIVNPRCGNKASLASFVLW